jgi:hypothetical protein
MILLSSSTVLPLFFISLKLIGEFNSLEEPAEVPEFATDAVFPADGLVFTGSERRTGPET